MVLRGDGTQSLELSVAFARSGEDTANALPLTRVRYGNRWAQVIAISEVGDHLGDDLADALSQAHQDDDVICDNRRVDSQGRQHDLYANRR